MIIKRHEIWHAFFPKEFTAAENLGIFSKGFTAENPLEKICAGFSNGFRVIKVRAIFFYELCRLNTV